MSCDLIAKWNKFFLNLTETCDMKSPIVILVVPWTETLSQSVNSSPSLQTAEEEDMRICRRVGGSMSHRVNIIIGSFNYY